MPFVMPFAARIVVSLAIAIGVFGLSAVPTGAAHNSKGYTVTVLEMPEGTYDSTTTAINRRGLVVGYFTRADHTIGAFIWSQGVTRELPEIPGYQNTSANDVNDHGVVVGAVSTGRGVSRAVIWQANSEPVLLDTLGGNRGWAEAINNRGEVVGESDTSNGDGHAFYWNAERGIVDLGAGRGNRSLAADINNHGLVVGSWRNSSTGEQRGFVWRDGVRRDIPLPSGYRSSWGFGVNDRGQVVGMLHGTIGSDSYFPAFRYGPGGMRVLPTLNGPCPMQETAPADLNSRGQIVGLVWDCLGHETGGIFQGGHWTYLNTLLHGGPPIDFERPAEINDLGQIVGVAVSERGRIAVLLTPVGQERPPGNN